MTSNMSGMNQKLVGIQIEDVSFSYLTVVHEDGADSQSFHNAMNKLKNGKTLTKAEKNIGIVNTVQQYHDKKFDLGMVTP